MNSLIERRKRNYFKVTRQQQLKHRKTILQKLAEAKEYAKSIGLEMESILLKRLDENEVSTKVIIKDKDNVEINKEDIVFKCLMAKDLTNLSCRKYKIVRMYLNFIYMPGINRVLYLQKKLNAFFETKRNIYGSYSNAYQKISFFCKKY